jgi:hypothetical protein
VGRDAQVLHDEVAIAFEACACGKRHRRGDCERLVNRQCLRLAALGRPGAFARPTLGPVIVIAVIRSVALVVGLGLGVHAARFEPRLGFLSLEHGDLIAQLLNLFRLPAVLLQQLFDLLQQLLDQRRALRFGDTRQSSGIGHGTKQIANYGELLPRILANSPSHLIQLPRLIENLREDKAP